MELSQKLKQARLDAGLSQKALCGDRITRNMLSQIENGSARPSMDTLRFFADRLGKPISFFLEEQAVLSPNQQLMAAARQGGDVLALLKDYQSPDPTFDRERWLLEALACMDAARQALTDQKPGPFCSRPPKPALRPPTTPRSWSAAGCCSVMTRAWMPVSWPPFCRN